MKKLVLVLGLVLHGVIVPNFDLAAYSMSTVKSIEEAAAVIKAAESSVKALAPETTPALDFIGMLADEINRLAHHAFLPQQGAQKSLLIPTAHVLDQISSNESWQVGPQWNQAWAKQFCTDFSVDFSHAMTLEIARIMQDSLLAWALEQGGQQTIKEVVAYRITDSLLTALVEPLVNATFLYIKEAKIANKGFDTSTRRFVVEGLQTFYRKLGYHLAGEIIRQYATARIRDGRI